MVYERYDFSILGRRYDLSPSSRRYSTLKAVMGVMLSPTHSNAYLVFSDPSGSDLKLGGPALPKKRICNKL